MSIGLLALNMYNRFGAARAQLTKQYMDVNGLRVSYLSNASAHTQDNRPWLLLLHGFSADKYIWNHLAAHLHQDYRLLIPDLKGHGETPYLSSDNYSVASQCNLVTGLLEQLSVSECFVAGNSMGGMMAGYLLKHHAELISKAVLLDPAGAISDFSQLAVQNKQNPFLHYSHDDFKQFYRAAMEQAPYVPSFVISSVADIYISKRAQFEHMFADFFDIDTFFSVDERFGENKALLIWGEKDALLPLCDADIWSTILQTETVIYENIGHMPMQEVPSKTAADIKQFFAVTEQ